MIWTAATKQRLEQELAEAAQEDQEESTGSGDASSSRGEGEEGGSGSDSEREAGPLPVTMQNSLEMSVWSLDVSLPPGGLESSVYETEVRGPWWLLFRLQTLLVNIPSPLYKSLFH